MTIEYPNINKTIMKKCHFCEDNEKSIINTIKKINEHIQNPKGLLDKRVCPTCSKILILKVFKTLGAVSI